MTATNICANFGGKWYSPECPPFQWEKGAHRRIMMQKSEILVHQI